MVTKIYLICLLLPKTCCVVVWGKDGDGETDVRAALAWSEFWFGILSETCSPTHHYFLYLLSNINKVCFTHLTMSFFILFFILWYHPSHHCYC